MAGLVDKVPVERNFNVSFSLEDVKSAMVRLSAFKKSFKIENKNDVFNSYTMSMVSGLSVVRPTIQLKKVSETETNVFMNCILREGNTISQNEVLDEYFNLLGMFLTTDDEGVKEYAKTQKEQKKVENKNANKVVLYIIIAFLIFLFFMSKWSPFYSN